MTTAVLTPETLPSRLQALGWSSEVHVRSEQPSQWAQLIDGPTVAIVGARAATAVAMRRAHHLATHLASRGVHVVSGGALGIDGAAHRGALAGNGTTTVVLGTGVDVLYPQRHAPLFREILGKGGALVSLLPDDAQPRRHTFLMRNPLIAALADVVIVVEADERSGSLSTAEAAKKLGKVVAAWPGSAGCTRLVARGAGLVESPEDAELALRGTPRRPRPIIPDDPVAQKIHEAMMSGARTLDAIVMRTGLTVREVMGALPLLERCS